MKHSFAVIKSTASKNGGFVNTLQTTVTATRFGVKASSVHRFMMKTNEQLETGVTEDLDLNDFEINEFETEFEGDDGQLIKMKNKWLKEKVQ